MGGVFINYRTGDGDFAAALISRELSSRFGEDHVFLASRSIRPGEDFVERIIARIKQCDVMLTVIGPRWHSATTSNGQRRLDNPADWVRREIAAAFEHNLRVIPVFLDHTALLTEANVPAEIAALTRCQFLRLSHRNDTRDLARLIDELTDLEPGLVLSRLFVSAQRPTRNVLPSAWLRAEYELVPFTGRDAERASLSSWANGPEPVSASLVTGPSGQGKTRLARQLCRELADQGWATGIVHPHATAADMTSIARVDSPLLIVVDDVEIRVEQVQVLAAALLQRSTNAPPARLLLLGQHTMDVLHTLSADTSSPVSSLFQAPSAHVLAPLAPTMANRQTEFRRALNAFASYLDVPCTDVSPPADLDQDRYGSARVLHATALMALLHRHVDEDDQPGTPVPLPDPELHRAAHPECPYRGLQPFQEQDAPFFRGRDREIEQVYELMRRQPLVMVVGASGSGKSSLVRAGILPRLREQNVTVTVFRPAPGIEPLDLLAHALRPIVGAERTTGLAATDMPLLADAVVEAAGRLVLFVDQFEELVATDPGTARQLLGFVASLVHAVPARPAAAPALRAVVTGRSANLDEVLTSELAPLVSTALVPRMGRAELHAVVAGPTDRPLVLFEPGLIDRITADAADAPGQLPLVEFALTQLWESQQGGTLTHRAYDELGGVAGALAAYAHEVYAQRLSPDEQTLTEELLVQLARPNEDGTFTSCPTRFDQLDPASRALARTLAIHRLVVIRHDPGQPEVLALAHEALVRQWPQLHDWLSAAQEFRAWQEQLRTALTQWRQADRDPNTLLRGVPLDQAERWLRKRPHGLSDYERIYIAASHTHQRRRVRQWRAVVAVISVLALIATMSAGLAIRQSQELSDQLRRQAALFLAQESRRLSDTDESMARQFAQAAWKHDPGNTDAYTALLRQYLRDADVAEFRTGLWPEHSTIFKSSDDGRVVAAATATGQITIWIDLFGSSPQHWSVTTTPQIDNLYLSRDGRWMAVTDHRGGVTLWNVERRAGPVPVRKPEAADGLSASYVRSAAFSPDNAALVMTMASRGAENNTKPDAVLVWYTTLAASAAYSFSATTANFGDLQKVVDVRDREIVEVISGTEAWFVETSANVGKRLILRNLKLGIQLRDVRGELLSRNGYAECSPSGITVFELATGTPRSMTSSSNCSGALMYGLDLTGRHVLASGGTAEDSFLLLDTIDLGTGQVYQLRIPNFRSKPSPDESDRPQFMVLQSESRSPTAFQVSGSGLTRFKPPRQMGDFIGYDYREASNDAALSPDGHLLATYTGPVPRDTRPVPGEAAVHSLEVIDTDTQRRILADNQLRLHESPHLTFTADGKRILAFADPDHLIVLSAANIEVERKIPLPASEVETGSERVTSIVATFDDEAVVLSAGWLTRWRAATGERVGEPLRVPAGPQQHVRSKGFPAASVVAGQHTHVLAVTDDSVELWDLNRGQRVRSFRPHPGTPIADVISDPNSRQVVVYYDTLKQFHQWSPDQDTPGQPPISIPVTPGTDHAAASYRLVAIVAAHKLITVLNSGEMQAWDLRSGKSVATFRPPRDSQNHSPRWWLRDTTLIAMTQRGTSSIDMNPQHWIAHLCAINDRDYTPEEYAVLIPGAVRARPCEIH